MGLRDAGLPRPLPLPSPAGRYIATVSEKARLPLPPRIRMTSFCARAARYSSDQKARFARAAEGRQAAVRSALDRLEGRLSEGGELLTEERLYILSLPPSSLLQCLRERQLSPTQVLRAYQSKAIVVTYRLNCITEFIPQAEDWAAELEGRGSDGRVLPLYGLPISVQDSIDVQGLDSTLGLAKRLGRPANRNAALIQGLRRQGAVPFCKTNVPQALLGIGCSNPVWGTTHNPVDTQRSPGGASGGEAALVGAGGSLLGVGVDTLGGVRVPAHFCGVTAFRPTGGRLSSLGVDLGGRGGRGRAIGRDSGGLSLSPPPPPVSVGVHSTPGFLARDTITIITTLRAILENPDLTIEDPLIPPVPWRQDLLDGGLGGGLGDLGGGLGGSGGRGSFRIGVFEEDVGLPPTPGCRRAVAISREALISAGHTLVAFTPPGAARAWGLALACLTADQGAWLRGALAGEARNPGVGCLPEVLAMPKGIRTLLRWILRDRAPVGVDSATGKASSSKGLWGVLEERKRVVEEVLAAWKGAGLDAVICPAFQMPAPKMNHVARLFGSQASPAVPSLYNFPCGVVPVTRESDDDQEKLEDYPEDSPALRNVKKATEGAEGLPIAVQVVGLPWQDEIVCRLMLDLELQMEKRH
ncbi:fatty-acid amide hydrolase 1-like [Eriocheir sinensis]|uniref:fatty-acid amide hydrolase 1-like n=1 Tax=Eriocheir sinensis TaxID=95602 RepID=UPI0021C964D9|nr:fatty-acid amide hydrolase 1-like [Eriocheir sinensis]